VVKVPKVSILMNDYNAELYLKEAIESIYAKIYNNWEIIFVDLIADRSEVVLGFRPHINFLNNSIETDTERLIISNSKLPDLGFKIDNNLSDEIDQLLLNCNKWFSN
jgi:hypothetical protein